LEPEVIGDGTVHPSLSASVLVGDTAHGDMDTLIMAGTGIIHGIGTTPITGLIMAATGMDIGMATGMVIMDIRPITVRELIMDQGDR